MTIPTITYLNYVIGQQVRLIIPPTFGCRELNEKTAYVIAITKPNEVTLDLNSLNANPFIASSATTVAQILAIGDINMGHTNYGRQNNRPYIPGSFRKILPHKEL